MDSEIQETMSDCQNCTVEFVESVDGGVAHQGGYRYETCTKHNDLVNEYLSDLASQRDVEPMSADTL